LAERENRWEIPAFIHARIWLGLAKDEHEWRRMQREGEVAVYAETVSNAVITIATMIRLRSDYDVSRAPASIRRDSTPAKMDMSIFRRSRIAVELQL